MTNETNNGVIDVEFGELSPEQLESLEKEGIIRSHRLGETGVDEFEVDSDRARTKLFDLVRVNLSPILLASDSLGNTKLIDGFHRSQEIIARKTGPARVVKLKGLTEKDILLIRLLAQSSTKRFDPFTVGQHVTQLHEIHGVSYKLLSSYLKFSEGGFRKVKGCYQGKAWLDEHRGNYQPANLTASHYSEIGLKVNNSQRKDVPATKVVSVIRAADDGKWNSKKLGDALAELLGIESKSKVTKKPSGEASAPTDDEVAEAETAQGEANAEKSDKPHPWDKFRKQIDTVLDDCFNVADGFEDQPICQLEIRPVSKQRADIRLRNIDLRSADTLAYAKLLLTFLLEFSKTQPIAENANADSQAS